MGVPLDGELRDSTELMRPARRDLLPPLPPPHTTFFHYSPVGPLTAGQFVVSPDLDPECRKAKLLLATGPQKLGSLFFYLVQTEQMKKSRSWYGGTEDTVTPTTSKCFITRLCRPFA